MLLFSNKLGACLPRLLQTSASIKLIVSTTHLSIWRARPRHSPRRLVRRLQKMDKSQQSISASWTCPRRFALESIVRYCTTRLWLRRTRLRQSFEFASRFALSWQVSCTMRRLLLSLRASIPSFTTYVSAQCKSTATLLSPARMSNICNSVHPQSRLSLRFGRSAC